MIAILALGAIGAIAWSRTRCAISTPAIVAATGAVVRIDARAQVRVGEDIEGGIDNVGSWPLRWRLRVCDHGFAIGRHRWLRSGIRLSVIDGWIRSR